jgi:hypothetical protein
MSMVLVVVFSTRKHAWHVIFIMAARKNCAAATPRQIDKNRMSKRISNLVLFSSLF